MTIEYTRQDPNLIKGTVVTLGNKTLMMPAMSFKSLKLLRADIERLNTIQSTMASTGQLIPDDEAITLIAKVVWHALQRNYKDITMDEVEENLDLDNVETLLTNAIVGTRGLKKGDTAQAVGKVEPEAPSQYGTSTSTLPLPTS